MLHSGTGIQRETLEDYITFLNIYIVDTECEEKRQKRMSIKGNFFLIRGVFKGKVGLHIFSNRRL